MAKTSPRAKEREDLHHVRESLGPSLVVGSVSGGGAICPHFCAVSLSSRIHPSTHFTRSLARSFFRLRLLDQSIAVSFGTVIL